MFLEIIMAWSPYKNQIIEFVRENPGCCKYDVAVAVTYRRNPSKSYHIVNTALKNKWIFACKNTDNSYSLFATRKELDKFLSSSDAEQEIDYQFIKIFGEKHDA